MFDTSEYYGGTYPSPYEEDEDEREEEFDYGDYIDYCYECYKDDVLTGDREDTLGLFKERGVNNNE